MSYNYEVYIELLPTLIIIDLMTSYAQLDQGINFLSDEGVILWVQAGSETSI